MKKTKILIVGGGFAGIKSALELCDVPSFEVTLLSNSRNFEHHPTLYRTATGGRRSISSIPLKEIFADKDIELRYGTAKKLDREKKTVATASGDKLHFDVVILALGVVTNYFGIKGLQEYSFGIKSLQDAEELKNHLHRQLIDEKKPDLNYIVVGGGPTGIELAGALPKYLEQIIKKHGLKPRKIHVDLVEGAPRLMPRMPHSVSRAIARRLRSLGVRLYLGKPVQAESADSLMVDGKPIRSHTVIWTAGIANHPFFTENNFICSPNGRVKVDKHLQAWPSVFVIGDNADTQYTGMAQTALHNADFVAENIKRSNLRSEEPKDYKPKKPVYITPAGPHWAAVVWGNVHLYGWLGWALRRAADWMSYKDVTPWWKAVELSLAEEDSEDSCILCANAAATK